MRRVRDIMTRDPITLGPQASLRHVAEVLATNHIGGLPIVEGDRLLGVVSASDLVDFMAATPPPEPDEDDPLWGDPGDEPGPTGEDLTPSFFYDVWPTTEDVLARMARTGHAGGGIEAHAAEELMTRRLLTIAPDADLRDAARRMLEESVHRLLVVDDGRLVGILTTRDLIRVLADTEPAAVAA